MTPKVSIIIATFNRAHFIAETLQSIKKQSFNDWECLIIDDGSTDNTLSTLMPFLCDSRFCYHKRPNYYNKGLPGSRNFGLDLSKGEYVIFFDDDDVVHYNNLEICSFELENQKVDFCVYKKSAFHDFFDYNFDFSKSYPSTSISVIDIDKVVKNQIPISSCSVMWKKKCFEDQRFNEKLMYAEEWELYLRMISNQLNGIFIDKQLYFARKHSNSNTGEFFDNNPIRVKSNVDAILLVAKNLNQKQLLSTSIKKYFFTICKQYESYNLFQKLLDNLQLTIFESVKWRFFYLLLPIRFYFYKLKSSK